MSDINYFIILAELFAIGTVYLLRPRSVVREILLLPLVLVPFLVDPYLKRFVDLDPPTGRDKHKRDPRGGPHYIFILHGSGRICHYIFHGSIFSRHTFLTAALRQFFPVTHFSHIRFVLCRRYGGVISSKDIIES